MVSMDDGLGPTEGRTEDSGGDAGDPPAARRSPPAFARPASRPALAPPGVVLEADLELREPAVEVLQTPRRIHLTVEIPGAIRDRIDVTATSSRVRIVAPTADERVFSRELELPEPVDPDGIVATYRNGVLDVTLPRRGALTPAPEG